MSSSRSQAILSYLRERQQDMVNTIEEMVLIESPSTEGSSQKAMFHLLEKHLQPLGFKVKHFSGKRLGGYLYAKPLNRSRNQPCQLLLGHCDTVWPRGTLSEMPIEMKGGQMTGPGVFDMKAGLVQIIYALKAIQSLNFQACVAPLILINSDEEIGSRESTGAIRSLAKVVKRSLVLEPSMGRTGLLKTARKGVGRFTVSVTGKAAHAGLDPESGVSAILELSHVIQKLFALNDPAKGVSVNVGMIDGGMRANVIAPASGAIVDVRVLRHQDAERIERDILNIKPETKGVSLYIEGCIGRPPMEKTAANQALWYLAKDLAAELGFALGEGTAGGGSDGNTTSLYTATLDGLGAVGDGAHAVHEHIDVSKLPERCALLALLILSPIQN